MPGFGQPIPTSTDLFRQAAEAAKTARQIHEKATAAGRDMTTDERETFDANFAEAKGLKARADTLKGDEATFAEVDKLRQAMNGSTTPAGASRGAKSAWAGEVTTRLTKTVGTYGAKAITTGGIDVPQPVDTTSAATIPVEATRVLDLVTDRPNLPGNEFSFLRQVARSANAGPVADGATKPTSTYTFEQVTDKARVFAHLSEPFPQRYLDDHAELQSIIGDQMAEDLFRAIELDILTGDGTGQHFTGLEHTSGVRAQAFTSDVLRTVRKARTTMVTAGEVPTAWVLNHDDLEAIDLLREDNGGTDTGGFLAGVEDKVFGNLPRIGSSIVPVGVAWLGDWAQLALRIREDGHLDADTSGDNFTHNTIRLRFEGRFGFSVRRPAAFVRIDLTT